MATQEAQQATQPAQAARYRMNVYWSQRDNLWLVEVPDLPGAMADGATPEDAVRMAQEVIENWLMVARMDGRPIPEPQEYDVPA